MIMVATLDSLILMLRLVYYSYVRPPSLDSTAGVRVELPVMFEARRGYRPSAGHDC